MLDAPEAPPPYEPLVVHDGAEMLQQPAPPRRWLVEGIFPRKDVALLGGDGGQGKTTLGMQLAHACAVGWTWLDLKVGQCPSVFYSAEDDRDEFHFRLEQITKQILAGPVVKNMISFFDVSGKDAELALFDAAGQIHLTERFHDLERQVKAKKAGLLLLDAAADVFGGNEILRRQVRAFLRELRGLGDRNDCAIVILTHPSQQGMKSGDGSSGSTHWHNSVRSRLYMRTPTNDAGKPDDPDLREIVVKKNNRGKTNQKIMARWKDGVFAVETPASASNALTRGRAQCVFLDLLREFRRQGRNVNTKPKGSYAPKLMAQHPDSERVTKEAFAYAMEELLRDGKICVVETGPPSERTETLEIAGNDTDAT
jgi:RecA-family ATPase